MSHTDNTPHSPLTPQTCAAGPVSETIHPTSPIADRLYQLAALAVGVFLLVTLL